MTTDTVVQMLHPGTAKVRAGAVSKTLCASLAVEILTWKLQMGQDDEQVAMALKCGGSENRLPNLGPPLGETLAFSVPAQ